MGALCGKVGGFASHVGQGRVHLRENVGFRMDCLGSFWVMMVGVFEHRVVKMGCSMDADHMQMLAFANMGIQTSYIQLHSLSANQSLLWKNDL